MRQAYPPRGLKVIQTIATSRAGHLHPTLLRNRIGDRRKLRVPGRLTWRDASGALRFVSVITRDVSDVDAFVECQVPASIPLYRLVHFQIERNGRDTADLPPVLKHGKVLSAVYRVGPYRSATGTPQGYALRLLIEPAHSVPARTRPSLATAN
jgi:hypothetical protein